LDIFSLSCTYPPPLHWLSLPKASQLLGGNGEGMNILEVSVASLAEIHSSNQDTRRQDQRKTVEILLKVKRFPFFLCSCNG